MNKKIFDFINNITPEDEKYILEQEENRLKEKQREQERILLVHFRSKKSGVPKKFWNESFETYKPRTPQEENNLNTVKKFSKRKKNDKVLILYGNVGTGKSHLAASIIRECGGYMTTAQAIIFKINSSRNFKFDFTEYSLMEHYTRVKMLVIDEIGRTHQSDKEQESLSSILRTRYENCLPTVLVSNLGKNEIVTLLGEAVFDRLQETGISLKFETESIRPSKREELDNE